MVAESLAVSPAGISELVTKPKPTDQELVRLTLGGDREAFGELALRYEGALFGHLRRLSVCREDAEELTQEAFLKAYRALPTCNQPAAFGPWLFCIGTNLARDAGRRAGRRTFEVLEEIPELVDVRQPTPAERLDSVRTGQRVHEALSQLPSEIQAILNLHYREGMKFTQIAEILNRDVKAIRVSVHRARQRLRKLLGNLREGKR